MRYLFFLSLLIPAGTFAQTGPGGVGNSTTNVLWLKTDAEVFSDAGVTAANNNDNVRQWNDQSGNGVDAAQATAGNRPNFITNVLNAHPVLRYTSANNDVLTVTGMSNANNASVWFVAAYFSLPQPNPGLMQATPAGLSASTGANDKAIGLWVANNGNVWGRGVQSDNAQRNISQVTNLSANTFYSIGTLYRSNRIDQYVNSAAAGNNTLHNGTLKSWTDAAVGRQGSESWSGDIAEVIMFNVAVNETQRILIDNYLSAKYGLSLSANDLYTMDDPVNGNYDFDVAGIGRANASNIHDDAQGVMVRILNPSNLNDNEFLFWGHNNGIAQALNNADVPAGVQARFERVWRVSEVNLSGSSVDVGNIDMRWDLNGLGTVTASDLRLLVDTDNDATFADETPVTGAVDLGGGIYGFSNVSTISDQNRFTMATINSNQTPLPVELVSFEVKNVKNEYVSIAWATASEINNDFFLLERSGNGYDFESIEKIKGAGNASTLIRYRTEDHRPLPGAAYYRLKQTDFNGNYEYSAIRAVDLSERDLFVYPNPVHDQLTLEGDPYYREAWRIYDATGKEVTDKIVMTVENETKVNLDLSGLLPGVYYIQTETAVSRVVKR